ncbi:MAG: hypothetical protein PW845_07360 [Pseudomonas sp.]|uniref:hypothetical protein n=1 Tax=Pseudomonas abieticivorans TaxID=2931382 RepID=UPI0020C15036|nr:hypothetical protein [Pseudomonas sp. PIA16]MDE1165202.1 hypothetical protein [Pseudomonas sp.]
MKQRILAEIAEHRRDGEKVVELHLWSKAAVEAITRSKEYVDGEFMGIAVQLPQEGGQLAGMDYIVIVEG